MSTNQRIFSSRRRLLKTIRKPMMFEMKQRSGITWTPMRMRAHLLRREPPRLIRGSQFFLRSCSNLWVLPPIVWSANRGLATSAQCAFPTFWSPWWSKSATPIEWKDNLSDFWRRELTKSRRLPNPQINWKIQKSTNTSAGYKSGNKLKWPREGLRRRGRRCLPEERLFKE